MSKNNVENGNPTIVLGQLGVTLNGYQQEKLEAKKIINQLQKIQKKYYNLGWNTQNVYNSMNNIAGILKATVFLYMYNGDDAREKYNKLVNFIVNPDTQNEEYTALNTEASNLVQQAYNNQYSNENAKKYVNKIEQYKNQVVNLNILGVDIRLTAIILQEQLSLQSEKVKNLQQLIDSFGGVSESPIAGKFNSRLRQFSKRLNNVTNFINTNYPNVDIEWTDDDSTFDFNNPVFVNDIITDDEGLANVRVATDVNNDGAIDNKDVELLKQIVKLALAGKFSQDEKKKLTDMLDTNGDGLLNNVDTEWLESYLQDQKELAELPELPINQQSVNDEETSEIIEKVQNGEYDTKSSEPSQDDIEPEHIEVNDNISDLLSLTNNYYDYIFDEESWNKSYNEGALKLYYAANPTEDLWNETLGRGANFNDKEYLVDMFDNGNSSNITNSNVRFKATWENDNMQKITNVNTGAIYYMAKDVAVNNTYILYLNNTGTQVSTSSVKILEINYPGFTHSWLGTINAPGAKLPWIAPHFENMSGQYRIVFKYEGKDDVRPWNDTVFGKNDKVWGVASVAQEFGDNSFLIPENGNEGESTFDISKFQLVLE